MRRFREGDQALIVMDDRRWLVSLSNQTFSTHLGSLDLTQVIGKPDGWTTTFAGRNVSFFVPSLPDLLMKTKRQTQILYPKDIASILLFADIRPEDKILETGTGSGALLTALADRVRKGAIVTIEQRQEFQDLARHNLKRRFGAVPRNVRMVQADACDPKANTGVRKNWADKLILDLPEPWAALHLTDRLRSGGTLVVFNPQISQIQRVMRELPGYGFPRATVWETLVREWLVDARRLRPADHMRGHTGFLLLARKTTS